MIGQGTTLIPIVSNGRRAHARAGLLSSYSMDYKVRAALSWPDH